MNDFSESCEGKMAEDIDLSDALNYLTDAAHKWREIGIQLKIPSSKLDIIKSDNGDAEKCLMGMLTEFFKIKSCDQETWLKIVKALEASSVGEKNLARKIKEERLKSTPDDKSKVTTSLGNGNESLTTPGMNRYSKKMCCMCVMLIVLGATLIIATSLTVTLIVLISFNFKEIFEKINIHSDINIIPVNLMNYSDEFAISANDTVIVPNEPYPGSDIINLIIYPTSKINLKEIDLYKVSKTLPAKSRPVNVSDSLHVSIGDSDRLHLLDKRYVLNGTKLDITVNVTAYNSKQRKKNMDCLVEVYLFNTHESFTSFLKNLSEFEHANPCRLPQCLCITPDGQPHPLVSDISQSYKFTVVNTTLQEEDAIISYRINGTEYYYDGSDYPVSCSVPDKGKGTNKCNLTIAQSQDMVLALTKDEDEEYDVEMKYEIEVQQLKVQCQASNPLTMYICLWVLAGALFIFLLFGIILCCVISHVLYVILRTST